MTITNNIIVKKVTKEVKTTDGVNITLNEQETRMLTAIIGSVPFSQAQAVCREENIEVNNSDINDFITGLYNKLRSL